MTNKPTLFWYSRGIAQWVDTTAAPTEAKANETRRMGYAVRIATERPFGLPSREDWIAVRDAGGSWWGEGDAP